MRILRLAPSLSTFMPLLLPVVSLTRMSSTSTRRRNPLGVGISTGRVRKMPWRWAVKTTWMSSRTSMSPSFCRFRSTSNWVM